MFNARTLGNNNSAFKNLSKNKAFIFIALIIIVLQIIIVEFGGKFFRTEPLDIKTWILIIVSTSFVLWVGELFRLIKKNRR